VPSPLKFSMSNSAMALTAFTRAEGFGNEYAVPPGGEHDAVHHAFFAGGGKRR
jgi:hypothetical protein